MSKPGFPQSERIIRHYSSHYVDGSGNDYPGSNGGEMETWWRDKTGNNTPGWPHVKQENYYMTVSSSVQDSPINYDFHGPTGDLAYGADSSATKAVSSNAASTVLEHSWPIIIELYGQAQAKTYNRLISQVKAQKVNYAQAFAERQQTVNLVVSTARRLAESFMALRRGNVAHAITALTGSSRPRQRGISRVAGGIPEQWLALQYGWKPLLSDIYGSAEELARYMTDADSVLTLAKAYASASCSDQGVVTLLGTHSGDPDWHLSYSAKAKGSAFVDWFVSNSVALVAGRTGLTNPLQLAWELLPYSFVVDWFLPIGNYLANLDYSNGLEFHRGWESMKIEVDWTASAFNTSRFPSGFVSGSWSGGGFKAKVNYYQRLPVGSFPLPPLPHLKDPFSPTHVANALSLLATAFSSTSRVR